jgi:hypothetical protein
MLDLLQGIVPALAERGTMDVRREETHRRFDTCVECRLALPSDQCCAHVHISGADGLTSETRRDGRTLNAWTILC